jgi:hypothetical protein
MDFKESKPAAPEKPKVKIIDSLWAFLVATAVMGPLALPLLWRNPRYKVSTKVAGSVAVIAFTYFLIHFAATFLDNMYNDLMQQVEQTQGMPN